MSKRDSSDHAAPNPIKRHKTAIEQEIEEAEEYERRKEIEQRRAQRLKLLSQDGNSNPAQETMRNISRHRDDRHLSATFELGLPSKGENNGKGAMNLLDSKKGGSTQGLVTSSNASDLIKAKAHTENKSDSQRNSAVLGCEVIGKLRLPRSLLEKWVEEPFFENAVVGCFVRLGVGMAPGTRSEPQYKVCEIVSVGKYKHAYSFGEFETTKALMLQIGHNQRLWRMNVISNHRFTDGELREWLSLMRADRLPVPSAQEIDERKARMRKAVFGHTLGVEKSKTSDPIDPKTEFDWTSTSESIPMYSEADVLKLVDARRKRSEAARFRERQAETVSRLNHGQMRTRYEHEVCRARDTYASILLSQSKELVITPDLEAAIRKVEQTEPWQRVDNDVFEQDLDALASRLLETRRMQICNPENGETGETEGCQVARRLHREARQKLMDFRKNALNHRKKRDTDVPSRSSMLHTINEAKKHENALADIAHGEKKKRQELDHDSHADHMVFQRRATKPTMLWTTNREGKDINPAVDNEGQKKSCGGQVEFHEFVDSPLPSLQKGADSHVAASITCATLEVSKRPKSARTRTGMSLSEYLSQKSQIERNI
jgi:hypothetical protein